MNKEIYEGLQGIINEMISIRQKVSEELSRRVKDYNMDNQERVHIKLQQQNNTEKIAYYARIKVELKRIYEK